MQLLLVVLVALPLALAANLVLNGNFTGGATNDFPDWHQETPEGTNGNWYYQASGFAPVTNASILAPPSGYSAYALGEAALGGTITLLLQNISIPAANITSATFSALYWNTQTGAWGQGNWTNCARIDFLDGTSNVNTTAPLYTVYNATTNVVTWTTLSVDVSAFIAAHAGTTVVLRIAVSALGTNVTFGVDNVQLLATFADTTSGGFPVSSITATTGASPATTGASPATTGASPTSATSATTGTSTSANEAQFTFQVSNCLNATELNATRYAFAAACNTSPSNIVLIAPNSCNTRSAITYTCQITSTNGDAVQRAALVTTALNSNTLQNAPSSIIAGSASTVAPVTTGSGIIPAASLMLSVLTFALVFMM